MSRTYYEILGLPRDASEAQVKNAYHKLALKYHPDKAPGPAEAAEMEEKFSQISTAYNVLKDRDKRQAYDQSLEKGRAQQAENPSAPAAKSSSDSSPSMRGPSMTSGAALEKTRDAVAKRALKRGLQLMQVGEYFKAAEFFETAIKNGGAEEAIYYGKLAQTLLRGQRSFSRATEAAKKAIELDPYNSEYRLILAELYESVGSQSKAIEVYEEILKWDATNPRALDRLNTLQPKKATLTDHILKFLGRK